MDILEFMVPILAAIASAQAPIEPPYVPPEPPPIPVNCNKQQQLRFLWKTANPDRLVFYWEHGATGVRSSYVFNRGQCTLDVPSDMWYCGLDWDVPNDKSHYWIWYQNGSRTVEPVCVVNAWS